MTCGSRLENCISAPQWKVAEPVPALGLTVIQVMEGLKPQPHRSGFTLFSLLANQEPHTHLFTRGPSDFSGYRPGLLTVMLNTWTQKLPGLQVTRHQSCKRLGFITASRHTNQGIHFMSSSDKVRTYLSLGETLHYFVTHAPRLRPTMLNRECLYSMPFQRFTVK